MATKFGVAISIPFDTTKELVSKNCKICKFVWEGGGQTAAKLGHAQKNLSGAFERPYMDIIWAKI